MNYLDQTALYLEYAVRYSGYIIVVCVGLVYGLWNLFKRLMRDYI